MTQLSKYKIINYLLFQVCWLACVWGAAAGYPWLSLVAFLPTLLLHLNWTKAPRAELYLLSVCAVAGIAFDGILLATGWVAFPNGEWIPGLAPYWMMILWISLGTTLNLSMSWMKDHLVAATVFGAIGGPLAYLAGERLGGIELINTTAALITLAIGWGLVLPFLAGCAQRLNGFESHSLPEYIIDDKTPGRVIQNG